MSQRIASAALYHGCILSLPAGAHHSALIVTAQRFFNIQPSHIHHHNHGFLTADGMFVNRIQAMDIAFAAGQIRSEVDGAELYAEHIWPSGA